MDKTPTSHPAPGDTYERSDITPRPIVIAVAAAVIFVAMVFVAMWVLTGAYANYVAKHSAPANPLAAQFALKQPPLPRLQTLPVKDLQALHASENQALHSYAWIDRAAGSVRIPIERAIELTAQRGLPARPAESAGGK